LVERYWHVKDTDMWNRSTERETCPIATSSYTKSTGNRRGSNPGCCSERLMTYHLIHCTAIEALS
jgi:hypothetical protein